MQAACLEEPGQIDLAALPKQGFPIRLLGRGIRFEVHAQLQRVLSVHEHVASSVTSTVCGFWLVVNVPRKKLFNSLLWIRPMKGARAARLAE
jgi:hypothetical protein